jgi:hypothetical protein
VGDNANLLVLSEASCFMFFSPLDCWVRVGATIAHISMSRFQSEHPSTGSYGVV